MWRDVPFARLFTKSMANDDFSEPPRRADSKNPIFFFSRFLGLGHLRGLGVRLSRILGVLSIEPLLGEGGGSGRRALSTPPPPPGNENPASLVVDARIMKELGCPLKMKRGEAHVLDGGFGGR